MTTTAPLFVWAEKYSVGLPAIDSQHKQLIGFINALHAAMGSGKGKDVLAPILENLIRYTRTHFAFEEEMLRQRGYPQLPAHSRIHKELTQEVVDLQGKFASGKLALSMDVMEFLKRWLGDHILGHDLAYAKALAAQPR